MTKRSPPPSRVSAEAPRPFDGERDLHRLNFQGTKSAKDLGTRLAALSRENRDADGRTLLDLLAADQGMAVVADPLTVRVAALVRDGATTAKALIGVLVAEGQAGIEIHAVGTVHELEVRLDAAVRDLRDATRRGDENAIQAVDFKRRLMIADETLSAAGTTISQMQRDLLEAQRVAEAAQRVAETVQREAAAASRPTFPHLAAGISGAATDLDDGPRVAAPVIVPDERVTPSMPPMAKSRIGAWLDRAAATTLRGARNAAIVMIVGCLGTVAVGMVMTQSLLRRRCAKFRASVRAAA